MEPRNEEPPYPMSFAELLFLWLPPFLCHMLVFLPVVSNANHHAYAITGFLLVHLTTGIQLSFCYFYILGWPCYAWPFSYLSFYRIQPIDAAFPNIPASERKSLHKHLVLAFHGAYLAIDIVGYCLMAMAYGPLLSIASWQAITVPGVEYFTSIIWFVSVVFALRQEMREIDRVFAPKQSATTAAPSGEAAR